MLHVFPRCEPAPAAHVRAEGAVTGQEADVLEWSAGDPGEEERDHPHQSRKEEHDPYRQRPGLDVLMTVGGAWVVGHAGLYEGSAEGTGSGTARGLALALMADGPG